MSAKIKSEFERLHLKAKATMESGEVNLYCKYVKPLKSGDWAVGFECNDDLKTAIKAAKDLNSWVYNASSSLIFREPLHYVIANGLPLSINLSYPERDILKVKEDNPNCSSSLVSVKWANPNAKTDYDRAIFESHQIDPCPEGNCLCHKNGNLPSDLRSSSSAVLAFKDPYEADRMIQKGLSLNGYHFLVKKSVRKIPLCRKCGGVNHIEAHCRSGEKCGWCGSNEHRSSSCKCPEDCTDMRLCEHINRRCILCPSEKSVGHGAFQECCETRREKVRHFEQKLDTPFFTQLFY